MPWSYLSRLFSRLLPAIFVFISVIAAAQSLSPDEVRITTRPYSRPAVEFRAKAELVDIGVVVRDSHGLAVPGLDRDAFSVYDDGKPASVKTFSVAVEHTAVATRAKQPTGAESTVAAAQPVSAAVVAASARSIALFFDDMSTTGGDLGRAKAAARRFLATYVHAGDRFAVFTSSGTREVPYTNDTSKLLAGIDAVQSHVRVSENGIAVCPRITPYQAYEIVNNLDPMAVQTAATDTANCPDQMDDFSGPANVTSAYGIPANADPQAVAIVSAVRAQAEQTWAMVRVSTLATLQALNIAVDSLSRQPGSRMLVLASSGFLAGTMEDAQDMIIDRALHAGVVINAIDAKGLYAEAPGLPPGEIPQSANIWALVKSLIFNSISLGPKLMEVDMPLVHFAESTGGILFRNNNDLDLAFRMVGMVPSVTYRLAIEPAHDGRYHKLRVVVHGVNGDIVQVRPGYFAPGRDVQPAETAQAQVDAAVAGTDSATGVPARVTVRDELATGGAHAISVSVHVDLAALPFTSRSGRHLETLTFIAALRKANGDLIEGKESEMQFALKDASFKKLAATGITAKLSLRAPKGQYQLREIVREGVDGKLFASTTPVEIP